MKNVILVVDDNREIVDSLTALFLQHGWITQRAYSGREALDFISYLRPSLVISDLAMPRMSGYDVAEELRRIYGDKCPTLIALTAWTDPGVAKQALRSGFNIVLTKPIDFEHLLSVVRLGVRAGAELPALAGTRGI